MFTNNVKGRLKQKEGLTQKLLLDESMDYIKIRKNVGDAKTG